MKLLSGLAKFGLSGDGELDILKEDTPEKPHADVAAEAPKVVEEPKEQDFLLDRKITCIVCDKEFTAKTVRSSKIKRLEPDGDLRPRHQYVDTVKYGVYACPHCGYAGLIRNFEHITSTQRKWVRESISANFKPVEQKPQDVYSYEQAIERYELALVSTMAKKGKLSEKAYICLNIAWLRRAQLETLTDESKRAEIQEEYDGFYRQAYDGFIKMTATETPPYNGMDANTVDYIVAHMAVYFKEYDVASKLISRLLTASGTSSRMKDKCLDMKDEIVAALRSN